VDLGEIQAQVRCVSDVERVTSGDLGTSWLLFVLTQRWDFPIQGLDDFNLGRMELGFAPSQSK